MAVHVIGLTGGIASGKSAVAHQLAARGAAVVDADLLAREVVRPGQPALAELVARFGAAILTPEGQLDRKRLGAIAFSDPSARADVNRITHPRIAAASAAAIAAWADAGAGVVFYEAALLVENRAHLGLAALVVVAASPAVQLARLRARDGLSAEEAQARIAAQAPLGDKRAAATWVIENDGEVDDLHREVARVAAAIEERFGPIRVPSAPGARRPGTAPGAPGGGRGPRGAALVTGYPAPLARRTIAALLDPGDRDAGDGAPIYVLAAAGHAEEAARFVAALPGGARARILEGEVTAMDLGLSSAEHRALSSELSWIHHLSGAAVVGADVEAGRRLIVGGTRTVLDLARDAKRLERVVHWSSVLVSGDRTGTFREPDLDLGQRHESWVARAQLEAEVVVRAAMRGLPITVLRPSHVIGAAGQVRAASDRGAPAASPPPGSADDGAGAPDAIAALVSAIARAELSPAAVRAAWSLPARLVGGARGVGRAGASAPLHVVPIDFVVAAGAWVIGAERAAGRTFHLVDPAPLPLREVAVRVAELLAAAAPTSTRARSRLGRALRVAQLARGPRELQALRSPPVRYSDTEAAAALAGSGITCPPLVDYLPDLVRAAVAAARAAPASPAPAARRDDLADEDAQDPLA